MDETITKIADVNGMHYGEGDPQVFHVHDFVIDKEFLLTNDTDADGDTLSIASVTDGDKGTITIDSDGNIVYTSTNNGAIHDEVDGAYDNYDTFTYTVTDGITESEPATVTIDLNTGNIRADDVVSGLSDSEFVIGTDGSDVLNVSDTLNLANVSNIETIDLKGSATVTGSGSDLGITIDDVISATSTDTLVIQVSEGASTDNLVTVDTSTFLPMTNDGVYNIFSDGTSTLLIDIDIPIDAV
jgi:VCBS repeat-containing protein